MGEFRRSPMNFRHHAIQLIQGRHTLSISLDAGGERVQYLSIGDKRAGLDAEEAIKAIESRGVYVFGTGTFFSEG
jgi:hypothetical protein